MKTTLLTAALAALAFATAPAFAQQKLLPAQSEISFTSKQMGVPVDKPLAEILKAAHGNLAFALAGLVLLHVAGAVKHQVIDRDGLIRRMGWGAR